MSCAMPTAKEVSETADVELGEGCFVQYKRGFILPAASDAILQQLMDETPFEQKDQVIMGRKVKQPRLTCYYATDTDRGTYTYSGVLNTPSRFTPLVDQLRNSVQEYVREEFDTVLLNYYRDGGDTVGWHADDEKLYGATPTIASLSFGSGRDFFMRRIEDHNDMYKFTLGPGDLLVMKGKTQQQWQHTVPRRSPPHLVGPRINLTFRHIVHPEPPPKQRQPRQSRAQKPKSASPLKQASSQPTPALRVSAPVFMPSATRPVPSHTDKLARHSAQHLMEQHIRQLKMQQWVNQQVNQLLQQAAAVQQAQQAQRQQGQNQVSTWEQQQQLQQQQQEEVGRSRGASTREAFPLPSSTWEQQAQRQQQQQEEVCRSWGANTRQPLPLPSLPSVQDPTPSPFPVHLPFRYACGSRSPSPTLPPHFSQTSTGLHRNGPSLQGQHCCPPTASNAGDAPSASSTLCGASASDAPGGPSASNALCSSVPDSRHPRPLSHLSSASQPATLAAGPRMPHSAQITALQNEPPEQRAPPLALIEQLHQLHHIQQQRQQQQQHPQPQRHHFKQQQQQQQQQQQHQQQQQQQQQQQLQHPQQHDQHWQELAATEPNPICEEPMHEAHDRQQGPSPTPKLPSFAAQVQQQQQVSGANSSCWGERPPLSGCMQQATTTTSWQSHSSTSTHSLGLDSNSKAGGPCSSTCAGGGAAASGTSAGDEGAEAQDKQECGNGLQTARAAPSTSAPAPGTAHDTQPEVKASQHSTHVTGSESVPAAPSAVSPWKAALLKAKAPTRTPCQ